MRVDEKESRRTRPLPSGRPAASASPRVRAIVEREIDGRRQSDRRVHATSKSPRRSPSRTNGNGAVCAKNRTPALMPQREHHGRRRASMRHVRGSVFPGPAGVDVEQQRALEADEDQVGQHGVEEQASRSKRREKPPVPITTTGSFGKACSRISRVSSADHGTVAEIQSRLDALDGGAPDQLGGRHDLDRRQARGVLLEGLHGDPDARHDQAAEIVAVRRDDVERGRGPEVDDDDVAAGIQMQRRQWRWRRGRDRRRAGCDTGSCSPVFAPDCRTNGSTPEVLPTAAPQRVDDLGNDGTQRDLADGGGIAAVLPKHAQQEQSELVGRARRPRGLAEPDGQRSLSNTPPKMCALPTSSARFIARLPPARCRSGERRRGGRRPAAGRPGLRHSRRRNPERVSSRAASSGVGADDSTS